MGTSRPHVTVRAATLAGGDKNQDRYAHGDGWAFVLDGASSFATTQPDHDGGWYAERLRDALSRELTASPLDAIEAIAARAIKAAAATHDDPRTCPTSTIALARWDGESAETYLLGDSTVALISTIGELVTSDTRLQSSASALRDRYRSRLQEGHGFDDSHRELLRRLQLKQAEVRNRPNGYWIAGGEPAAARHGMGHRRPLAGLETVVLASDGVADGNRYGTFASWTDVAYCDLVGLLDDIHAAEMEDPNGQKWPRSKLHDDKTVVTISFRTPTIHP